MLTTWKPSKNNFRRGYKAQSQFLTQQPRVRFLAFPRIFLLMLLILIDGTAYDSVQRLDNVNQMHLVLASGKLVQQKTLGVILPSEIPPQHFG